MAEVRLRGRRRPHAGQEDDDDGREFHGRLAGGANAGKHDQARERAERTGGERHVADAEGRGHGHGQASIHE